MVWRAEFRGLATALGLVAIGVLLGASINLNIPGQAILQSLRFHIAVASLGVVVLLLAFGARWRALAMLAALCASVVQGAVPFWQLHERRDVVEARTVVGSLDLLSFNVLAGNRRPMDVINYLRDNPADIAVIMESPGIEDYFPAIESTYPYVAGCEHACDTSIHSRLPLSDISVQPFGPMRYERLITASTEVGGQKVTIVATHLSKPYFDEMPEFELYELARWLRTLDGPLILTGDFNAAPWSDALIRLVSATNLVPPPWPPATWPVRASVAGVPIDNMFTRDGALISSIYALPDALGSNHRGLRAQVDIVAP